MELMLWTFLQGQWQAAHMQQHPPQPHPASQPRNSSQGPQPACNSPPQIPPIFSLLSGVLFTHFQWAFPCLSLLPQLLLFYPLANKTHEWPEHSYNITRQFISVQWDMHACRNHCVFHCLSGQILPLDLQQADWQNRMTEVIKSIDFKSISFITRVPLTLLLRQILWCIHLLWWQTSFRNS